MATIRDFVGTSVTVNMEFHVNIIVVKSKTFPSQVAQGRKGDNILGFRPYGDIWHN